MREMVQKQQDVFYGVTAMNENFAQTKPAQTNLPESAVASVSRGYDGSRTTQAAGSSAAAGAAKSIAAMDKISLRAQTVCVAKA